MRGRVQVCDGLRRESSCFGFRDAENRERAFGYACCMVGASVASDDSTKGHNDQPQEDIQCDLVWTTLETSLLEARGEILSQIATDIARIGAVTIEQTQNCTTPRRVFRHPTQNAQRGVGKAPPWILVPGLRGGFRGP